MIQLALILCWNCLAPPQFPLSSAGARDETALGQVYLELHTNRQSYYVQEPISVELRFGFEETLFKNELVALFRPAMDLPVQLQAPWLANLAGAIALEPRDVAASSSMSFVLNDALTRAKILEQSNSAPWKFRGFSIERTFFASSAGPLELPESRLCFARGTRSNEGFVTEGVVDRVEAFVRGAGRTLPILPLPEAGRPVEFCGAVGRLTLRGEASAREVELGASLKLALHVEGEGNLEFFDVPRLEHLDGWRVNGSIDHKTNTERTIEYDLSPLSAKVTRVPQIPFAFFDTTEPASYRTLRTDPIAVVVRAGAPTNHALEPGESFQPEGGYNVVLAGVYIAIAACAVGLGRWLYVRRLRSMSRE